MSAVIGGACPALLCSPPACPAEARVALAVIALAKEESRRRGEVESAVARALAGLVDDGVVYVLAAPRARARIARELVRAGLELEGALLHLPDVRNGRYLVPLGGPAPGFALARLVPIRAARRALARAVLGRRMGTALRRVLPSVGLVARRGGEPPLLQWLSEATGVPAPLERVVLTTSHRGPGDTLVIHVLAADGEPAVVAKLGLEPALREAPARQAANLNEHRREAGAAGATVPEARETRFVDGRPLIVEDALPGRSAAAVLAGSPRRLPEVLGPVGDWLGRWQGSTASVRPLTSALLRDQLLAPAEVVSPFLEGGREYLQRLGKRCDELQGSPAPLVAAHNDLTMWNILLAADGRIGVVDWETATSETLPLGDAYYAATDAVAAVDRYRDRAAAFDACFPARGREGAAAAAVVGSAQASLDLPDEVAELCFHACWLHHAANEVRAGRRERDAPFVEIAARLLSRGFV